MASLERTAYTQAQLAAFTQRIALPPAYHLANRPALDYALLHALHSCTICACPYENLQMHYAPPAARVISTDPQHALAKALQPGRGGYCAELNVVLAHVLRAYGLRVYWAGAKIRPRAAGVPQGDFLFFCHAVVVAVLPYGQRYILDAAFGGDGPVRPLPLDETVVLHNIGAQRVRLRYGNIPGQTHSEAKYWLYEYAFAASADADAGADAVWNTSYAVNVDGEFSAADLEAVNILASTWPGSFLHTNVLIVKFLRDDDRGVYGKLMLVNGDVKLNEGGRTRVVQTCGTEGERVAALKEWFGIELSGDERTGIERMRLPA